MPKPKPSKRLVVVSYTLEIDPEEMARRGRLGAAATHSRYDGHQITAAARAARAASIASHKNQTDENPAGTARAEEAAHAAV
jgi:hypothetical protein